jgi:16S rRNA (guanine527-N7)-methyltransferase
MNANMEIIKKYFPRLTPEQLVQYARLQEIYEEWNARINVISRKDIGALYERHVLHALAIARFIRFVPGAHVLDVGTGGGFPGIPLAIFFPETHFHLIDSIGKKIKVVDAVTETLALKNVTSEQIRAEQLTGKYDFVVSRAVTRLPEFVSWIRKNIAARQQHAIPNGVISLKGGSLTDEIKPFGKNSLVQELSGYFNESFFLTKKLIYVPL